MSESHGIDVRNLTKRRPRNGLPSWIKEAAEIRGYGDALMLLSMMVTRDDIEEAFRLKGQGDGAICIMAQAGKRLGAEWVYFFRTTAWVDFGVGPLVRYQVSSDVERRLIVPFDEDVQGNCMPGLYQLLPPSRSKGLVEQRARNKDRTKNGNGTPKVSKAYMGRVVMAARQ